MPTAAVATTSFTSDRRMRRLPSRHSTNRAKMMPAQRKRVAENASGSHSPKAYLVVA